MRSFVSRGLRKFSWSSNRENTLRLLSITSFRFFNSFMYSYDE